MEQTPYAARLRYLDADDVDDTVVDFDGIEVRGRDDEKLGTIDGFIVDGASSRVHYAVIDSGGWFSSRRLLLPIGHATTIDRDGVFLRVDVSKDALAHYPRFDEGRFTAMSDDELRAFESATVAVCCPTEPALTGGAWPYESRRHYTPPDWWRPASYPGDRLRSVVAGSSASPTRERDDREQLVARDATEASKPSDDVSPHYAGRAQPGDVLGIETGGERTYMGETAEDEDQRRRDAQKTVAEDEPQRPER